MAGLMKQVEQRQLPKAGDADRDPADLAAIQPASDSADRTASKTAREKASVSASRKAGASDGVKASNTDGRNAGGAGAKKASGDRKASAGRKPRRVGRPLGPRRTPITVRILSEIDDALTAAVEDTGDSPQYIVDDALRAWLTEHGYFDRAS